MNKHILLLDQPASEWELATPIGNGYSGAMLYGRTDCELLQLTEEAIWSKKVPKEADPNFREKLARIRALLLEGEAVEAERYAKEALSDSFSRIGSQETAGELLLDFGSAEPVEDYRRELELRSGIATVSYRRAGERLVRESFASYPDRVLCTRIEGAHSLTLGYRRQRCRCTCNWSNGGETVYVTEEDPRFGIDSITAKDQLLSVSGHPQIGGRSFSLKLLVKSNGEVLARDESLFVRNATETELFITLAVGEEAPLPPSDYAALRARHVADHTSLMGRSELSFGEDPLAALPVDRRLERLRADPEATDPWLAALYFDFGKYLLIGSSRKGSLPANLQGVWNPYTDAMWNNDYHTNINLQMNYWHAEVAGLSECALPLFDYMKHNLLESGRRTAKELYGCRGTVVHHLSDIYGFTAPADGLWGLWQMGGAWLAYSMWEHYLFTRDLDFLQSTAYEYIHECVRFSLDSLFEDGKGRLLSGPTMSPENQYLKDGAPVYLCLSPTMDVEIIGGLLRFYLEIEELLGRDPDQEKEAREALLRLPPLQIGKRGQLMEWQEDYEEREPGHRHVSHLFAVYPDCAISEDQTPALMAAAKRSLELRLANGGGHTGWSAAWLILLFARMREPERAADMLRKLLTESTRGNLFDNHPPFQIDGNFGGTAAICEMLLQSQKEYIELLPACPELLSAGSFRDLRARGGRRVSARWEAGRLLSFSLVSDVGGTVEVRWRDRRWLVTLQAGEQADITV